ncbi:NAD-dependent protein deacylase [Patiriisocius marinistellae]|uniref:NAD-dependent protein deacylase n=1 Tax=Patiriisocius marinistellae TaxID=2494560 RepID=A0A5J4G0H5_9FLAO|nr:NAD-dependent deacylase [Patiriisocius marinistellae]GEQ85989.1 NAD-dependent protein deacylase [Patiriisocius marinistellae]
MKITVLTGAGVSAESGLKTFRDSNGLWEGHNVMEVASPQGFSSNPELVLDFYNQRRKQLLEVLPNAAHLALASLEKEHDVTIITQNVDDLHERAGSTKVIHLHGELLKSRSTYKEDSVIDCTTDILLGDVCENGFQMRPHIVWFGEAVPLIETAVEIIAKTDIVLIIGTSMQVYPAAGLMQYAPENIPVFFVDPNPSIDNSNRITIIAEKASTGVPKVIEAIKEIK